MRVAMIGTGYVGLVSGACFADFGHEVTCVDKDPSKIELLERGEIPIFEPGLDDLVAANVKGGRLSFALDGAEAIRAADAVFIAVGTPSRRGDGHADLSYVHAAAAARRRADGDEHRIGGADRLGPVQGERQPAALHIGRHQIVQTRLEDRDLAALQPLDLGRILVDAGHLMAEVGETGPRDQAHIAGSDHRYAHGRSSFSSFRPGWEAREMGRCGRLGNGPGAGPRPDAAGPERLSPPLPCQV